MHIFVAYVTCSPHVAIMQSDPAHHNMIICCFITKQLHVVLMCFCVSACELACVCFLCFCVLKSLVAECDVAYETQHMWQLYQLGQPILRLNWKYHSSNVATIIIHHHHRYEINTWLLLVICILTKDQYSTSPL